MVPDSPEFFIFGNIYTADEKQNFCEAIGIKNGRISFVGSREEAKTIMGSDAEIIETGEGCFLFECFLVNVN